MKNIERMTQIIKEYKEYQDIQEELKNQMELLKSEAIEMMTEDGVDEVVTDSGKVTYREVLSQRFDSTAFKKSEWAELYKEFSKQTASMRFTCN